MMLFDRIGHHTVTLITYGEWEPVALFIRLEVRGYATVLIDDIFPNSKVASAHLVSIIGHKDAVDLLDSYDIPKTHPLWDLNHSGLWENVR